MKTFSLVIAVITGAGVALLGLMTAADTISRIVGNGSLPYAFDVSVTVLIGAVFLSLGPIQRQDGHVSFSLVYDKLPAKGKWLLDVTGRSLILVFVSWAAFVSGGAALDSFSSGEAKLGIAKMPAWPDRALIAIGFLILALTVAVQLGRLLGSGDGSRTNDAREGDIAG